MTVEHENLGGFTRPPLLATARRAVRLVLRGDLTSFVRRTSRFLQRSINRESPPSYSAWRDQHVVLSPRDRQVVETWTQGQSGDFCQVVDLQDLIGWTPRSHSPSLTLVVDNSVLHDGAVMAFTLAAEQEPDAVVFYADHEVIDNDGTPVSANLKPGWNSEMALGCDYAGPALAIRNGHLDTILEAGVPSSSHDLLLRTTEGLGANQIKHLPYVLSSTSRIRARADTHAVSRATGSEPEKISTDGRSGFCRIYWPLPDPPPTVSIVIPTKDRGRLLKRCAEGLLQRTSYSKIELIIVDHASKQRSARRFIDGLAQSGQATVVSFDEDFNFSRMVNLGVAASRGELVCLLNNDTEVLEAGWLTELTRQALRPSVGVAGGLLLFPDGTIQHAGIHPGLGGFMGHGHKYRAHKDPGYYGRLTVTHEVAAVTGACMALRRSVWDQVGGMDENLPVAFNDVDLCLRVRERGLSVVLNPHAVVRHHESISRGTDDDPSKSARLAAEHRRMTERWGDLLDIDPAYHPDLSRDASGFSLAQTPSTTPPWRQPIYDAATEA